MTLEARKFRLIKMITGLENEALIAKLEHLLEHNSKSLETLLFLSRPLRESLNIETLMEEQNYQHPSEKELNAILEGANIQEPIEQLIQQI